MHLIRKHYLILTDAGKPIYSRYGDEITLAPFFATLIAMISKIQHYYWDPSQDSRQNTNRLHTVTSPMFKCYFMKKGALIYMCLTNLRIKNNIGSYFIDDLATLPTGSRTDKSKHVLMQDLMPMAVRDTAAYI